MDRSGKASRHGHSRRKPKVHGSDHHRMLNFKQFIMMREDEISPEEAAEEYRKYFQEFLSNEIRRYYDMYEHLAFFREKFHPYYLHIDHEITKVDVVNSNRDFVLKYTNGHFEELLLEISFKRLYGGSSSDVNSAPSEAPYKYSEWAYEIPVEYPKDDTHTKRLPIDSPLLSVLLVDVPDKVFKHEIQNALKPHLERFSIYMAERDLVRTAFISVDECDLTKLSETLNGNRLTVQEFLLRFEPCNPLQERVRVRVCPPVCSHPIIVARDVEITGRIIRKLDADFCDSGTSFVDMLPADIDIKKLVNIKAKSYIDLWDLCGPGHVRVDLSSALYEKETGLTTNHVAVKYASWETAKKGRALMEGPIRDWEKELTASCDVSTHQLQWLRDVESFAEHLLSCDLNPPAYVRDDDEIEDKWKQFCNINTLVDGPERFRCNLCHKLFNDAKFVWKHLKLKHVDCYDKIVIECGLPQMKEIFTGSHKAARCNPFERLLSVPVVQPLYDDVDAPSFERNGLSDSRNSTRLEANNKRRRREYFDFDRPQPKRVRFSLIDLSLVAGAHYVFRARRLFAPVSEV
ncbi:arsenite-resistance 2 [Babesia ovata]|uniref:Arsenite-resistance 2 n=1 Tax=Babesia ovata TaxID=189622 RepID=A0A2H6KI07_9APIC|nr:arsenite-resistance 2 [Babesia ovata]GBE62620.1 arsenite-resistance 2 [Babesia ovata]